MKKVLSGFFALALLTGVAAGCTDSGQSGRVGEGQSRDRSPSASPPTSSQPDLGSTPRGSSGGSPSPGDTGASRTPIAPPPTR
jgi:hypothetical protein